MPNIKNFTGNEMTRRDDPSTHDARLHGIGVITHVEYRGGNRRKPPSFDEGCNAEGV